MKWVKCVYKGSIDRLTVGKIYDVLKQYDRCITIIVDNGDRLIYFITIKDIIWFEDATAEIRDNKLNEIL